MFFTCHTAETVFNWACLAIVQFLEVMPSQFIQYRPARVAAHSKYGKQEAVVQLGLIYGCFVALECESAHTFKGQLTKLKSYHAYSDLKRTRNLKLSQVSCRNACKVLSFEAALQLSCTLFIKVSMSVQLSLPSLLGLLWKFCLISTHKKQSLKKVIKRHSWLSTVN